MKPRLRQAMPMRMPIKKPMRPTSAAAETEHHTQRAAEEGERADDDEPADDEAQRGRRAGAGLELLARHAHEERAEHEADDLRTDVLHLGGAVQAAGARGVAQETCNAEAHVGGVAHRRENEGGKTDGHAREDDTPMDLFHFLSTPCSFSLVIL